MAGTILFAGTHFCANSSAMVLPWDYLIVTASNDAQARAYRSQLAVRRDLGLLPGVGEAIVVADPGGKRIGSGGSAIACLLEVLNRQPGAEQRRCADLAEAEERLRRLRILIIHAGGDSRRLPAYGPCGKIFVPVPGNSGGPLGTTLFDRLLPVFLRLPPSAAGQLLVASGDALLLFDADAVRFSQTGLTALTCPAKPEQASKHGVFCADPARQVRFYLQKPTPAEQQRSGAIDGNGYSLLDLGVMNFDAAASTALLRSVGVVSGPHGLLTLRDSMQQTLAERGLDLYREICCAMGSEATKHHHVTSAQASGSTWDEPSLNRLFEGLRTVPFRVEVLPSCQFLHFGTTRQLITSGLKLVHADSGSCDRTVPLNVNNCLLPGGALSGPHSWVEGCRLSAELILGGDSVAVGMDIETRLSLPPGACLDVLRGQSRQGQAGWFVRSYGVNDTFKDAATKGATFCGLPVLRWLEMVGACTGSVWDAALPPDQRNLWHARLFPWSRTATAYHDWLWMYDPATATARQKQAFLSADRYSSGEIADRADQEDFYARRRAIHAVARELVSA